MSSFYRRLRKDFKQLLDETGYVTPGKKLDEVKEKAMKKLHLTDQTKFLLK